MQTITLTASLPAISDPVTIDGYTQPGAVPNTNGPGLGGNAVLLVEIDADAAGGGADTGVLTVTTGGGGTKIKGLVINRYVVNGIALVNSGGGNTVEGNYIGVNAAGDAAATSASSASGIEIRSLEAGSEDGDVIGGARSDARNVIAGNNGSGQVTIASGPSVGHRILNNFIGTNATGTASLSISGCTSSVQSGIAVGPGTGGISIGDGTVFGRNIISGNCARGISIVGPPMPPPLLNRVAGNLIGTDVTGAVALGNQGEGIALNGVSYTNVTGNVISASINTSNNAEGILVESAPGVVTIQGNRIGTDVSGTLNLGNQGAGILISNSSGVVVGGIGVIPGTGVREGNVIAFNGCCQLGGQPGVWVLSGTGNSIRGNSIFANTGLPIDLGGDGVTLNDDCDADVGPNGLQNFPVLTSVFSFGPNTTIYGALQSKASTTYQVDFYISSSCEPSAYIGTMPVTTYSSACGGNISAYFLIPFGPETRVTATATDPAGNTSEVSLCATAIPETLTVDPSSGATSDGNGVLEPGETVTVEPTWKNPRSPALSVTGAASDLTGPDGASHTTVDSSADYGSIPAFGTQSCHATGNCYSMFVSSPPVRPSPHWDAAFTETLSLTDTTKASRRPVGDRFTDVPGSHDFFDLTSTTKAWKLHVGDSFTDVPRSNLFYEKIETIFHNAITAGCSTTAYCPADKVSRAQMAIFIAREVAGGGANVPVSGNVPGGKPYDCVSGGASVFTDVSPTDIFCKSVHYLAAENVTSGCAAGLYCPGDLVSRAQMAIFIAKAIVAPGGGAAIPETYGPDPVTGLSYSCDPSSPSLFFSDVSTADAFCKHAHFLWAKGVIAGCSSNQYCPLLEVGRDEMAKFLANAFHLALYGP